MPKSKNNKKTGKKKMSETKRVAQNDKRERQRNVVRVGALLLVIVMVASLVAMYAL